MSDNRTGRCEVCDETPAHPSQRWPICKKCARSYWSSPLAGNSPSEVMAWAARRARLFERKRVNRG